MRFAASMVARVSENLFCCWVCFWFFGYVLFCLLDFTTTERDILRVRVSKNVLCVGYVFGFLFCFL